MPTNYSNYIYLRYANYMSYEPGHQDVGYFSKQRDYVLNQIKGDTNDRDVRIARELETILNSFFHPNPNGLPSVGMTEEQVQKITDSINQRIHSKFQGLYSFDPTTGSYKQHSSAQQKLDKIIKITKGVNNRLDLLEKKISDLQIIYEQMSAKDNNLEEQMRQLLKLWEQVKIEANILQQDTGQVIYNTNGGPKTPPSYAKFVEEFNTILAAIFASSAAAVSGEIGEYLVAEIMNTVLGVSKNAEKLVVGDLRSYAAFLSNMLPGQFTNTKNTTDDIFNNLFKDFKQKNTAYKGSHLEVYTNSHATQQKVDVQFRYDNTPIKASVKNIKLGKTATAGKNFKITTVSGTNPLVLLSNDSVVFHHYLNTTSQHSALHHSNISSQPPRAPYEPTSAVLAEAHNTIKTLMAIRATTGSSQRLSLKNQLIDGSANFFILNNSSSKSSAEKFSSNRYTNSARHILSK